MAIKQPEDQNRQSRAPNGAQIQAKLGPEMPGDIRTKPSLGSSPGFGAAVPGFLGRLFAGATTNVSTQTELQNGRVNGPKNGLSPALEPPTDDPSGLPVIPGRPVNSTVKPEDQSPIPGMSKQDYMNFLERAMSGEDDDLPPTFKAFVANLQDAESAKEKKRQWQDIIELLMHQALERQYERLMDRVRDLNDMADRLLEKIREVQARIDERNLRIADIREQEMDASDDLAYYKKHGRFRRDANGNLNDGTERLLADARRRGMNPKDDADLARILQYYLNPATSPYTPEKKQLTDANKKDADLIDQMKVAYDDVRAEAQDLARITQQIMNSNLSDAEKKQKLDDLIDSRKSTEAIKLAESLLVKANVNNDIIYNSYKKQIYEREVSAVSDIRATFSDHAIGKPIAADEIELMPDAKQIAPVDEIDELPSLKPNAAPGRANP